MEDHQDGVVVGYPVHYTNIRRNHDHDHHHSPRTNTSPTTDDSDDDFTTLQGLLMIIVYCVLAIALGVAVFISLQSTNNFQFPNYQIYQLHVHFLNLSDSSHLTTQWNVLVSVENHPDVHSVIYYQGIQASVFYNNQTFLSTKTEATEPFLLGEGKEKFFEVYIDSSALYVNQTVLEDVTNELATGALKFTLKLNATAVIDPGTKAETTRLTTVSCEDINIKFALDDRQLWVGDMLDGPEQHCSTYMF